MADNSANDLARRLFILCKVCCRFDNLGTGRRACQLLCVQTSRVDRLPEDGNSHGCRDGLHRSLRIARPSVDRGLDDRQSWLIVRSGVVYWLSPEFAEILWEFAALLEKSRFSDREGQRYSTLKDHLMGSAEFHEPVRVGNFILGYNEDSTILEIIDFRTVATVEKPAGWESPSDPTLPENLENESPSWDLSEGYSAWWKAPHRWKTRLRGLGFKEEDNGTFTRGPILILTWRALS